MRSLYIHLFFLPTLLLIAGNNIDLSAQQKAPKNVTIKTAKDTLELMDYRIVRFKLPPQNFQRTLPGQLTPGFRFTFRYNSPDQLIKGVSKEMSNVELYGATQSSESGLKLERLNASDNFFINYRPLEGGQSYYVTVDVPSRTLISVGNQFRVNGRIAFLTEKETAINTSGIIPLMIGEKIKAGPFLFQILELRQPEFGGDALELVLVPDRFTKENKDDILHINFFDQTGKTIRTKTKGSIGTAKFEKVIYSLNINPKKFVAEITYLKDKSFITVPFEIKTGFELKVRN